MFAMIIMTPDMVWNLSIQLIGVMLTLEALLGSLALWVVNILIKYHLEKQYSGILQTFQTKEDATETKEAIESRLDSLEGKPCKT